MPPKYVPTQEDLDHPCVVCDVVFDGKHKMVRCDTCKRWYHVACIGNPTISNEEEDPWSCQECIDKERANASGSGRTRNISSGNPTQISGNDEKITALEIVVDKQKKELEEMMQMNRRLIRILDVPNQSPSKPADLENAKISELEEKVSQQQKEFKKMMELNKKLMDKLTASESQQEAHGSKDSGNKRNIHKKSNKKPAPELESEDSSEEEEEYGSSNFNNNSRKSNPEAKSDTDTDDSDSDPISKFIVQQEFRELPSFDGSPMQWPSFYSSYMESKRFFSNTANRNRLHKALKGKAFKAVAGLLLSASTVNDAMAMLQFRFGQSETIINESIDQAMNAEQPVERKPETIVDYAMLVLTLNSNIKAVGEKADRMNPMLIKNLVERLPLGLQKKWNRHKRDLKERNKIVTISSLSKWLIKESQDYVDLMPTESRDHKRRGNQRSTINVHQQKFVPEQEHNQKPNVKKRSCFKCSAEHPLEDCAEFKQMLVRQRKEFAYKNNICFVCLRRGHRWRKCYKKDADGKRTFHNLINDKVNADSNINPEHPPVEATMSHYGAKKTLFKIVKVVLHGPVSQLTTYALLDECASTTLIEEEVAKKLKLNGPVVPLLMGWTKDITNLEENSMKVKLSISGPDVNSRRYQLKDVRTVNKLALPKQSLKAKTLREKYPYLNEVDVGDLESAVPTILIGLDNTNLIAPLETKVDPGEVGPVAVRTKLGWSVHGPEAHDKSNQNAHPTFLICECESLEVDRIDRMVEKYFSTEDFGIKLTTKLAESNEDKLAKEILKTTTKREGNGYTTGLLWRFKNIEMPCNYDMCLRRLASIEAKMSKDPEFGLAYRAKIEEYVNKNYARKLSTSEVQAISKNIWILPHFGTSTPSKPKLRLVFDAKAAYSGVSLNSLLLTGPDYYNSLVGVIYKFRQGIFAVAADIREMFHQVRIREEDQRFQCFLWRDGDSSKRPDTYIMNVMIFGATCSPCSAQYVKNLNALEFEDEHPRAVEGIIKRFYVDDYMDSFATEEEAIQVTSQVIEINRRGNFELRNVISNSRAVTSYFGSKNESVINMNLDGEHCTEKVLGLFWDTSTDEFLFKFNFLKIDPETLNSSRRPSKRDVLKILMSVFDPLGILAHYIVRAKMILQEVWMRKIQNWDSPLPEDITCKWKEWFKGLHEVKRVRIRRNYSELLLQASNIELHVFTDASERAYAAVAFMRIEVEQDVHVSLISGKTKIASQKTSKILSMPRLELQGALLGVRLAKLIQDDHSVKFASTTFWSDSQTVLSWIKTEYGSFKPFVAHRIAAILESSEPSQWRYISTKDNPADDATKPTKYDPFEVESRWFKGPVFLKEAAEQWRKDSFEKAVLSNDPEVRRIFIINEPDKNIVARAYDYGPIDPEKFSKWHEMLRVTAWAKRGLYNWSKRRKNLPTNQRPLSLDEINEAMRYHVKKCQLQSYTEEIKALLKNRPVSTKSKILDLQPFLDANGVMRMDGRIESSPNLSTDMKKPMILHPKHPVTRLLIQEFHEKFKHQFQEAIINEIRTKFWIPQLRVAVKDAKRRCQECRNDTSIPKPPQMAKLPMSRVAGMVGCFHYCGIDLFGPMYVTIKRSAEKRWGVVYTCLTSRAVYLDIVPDLSADSLIMSIRNCNARRGPIKHMYSDCGTNMKGANREMKEALSEIVNEGIHRECIKQEIEWHFNPPASPHMGGAWERMVRSIKNVLGKLMKEKRPKENTLRSLLCEVEDIINTRPLTYIALEKDSDDVLTPKHLMNPFFRSPSLPPGQFDEKDLSSRKQWRIVQELANHFWRRWTVEYLPMINRTTKWHTKAEPLRVGDIVVICDNSAPRNQWEKAVVAEVKLSRDGQVRSAIVKTSHGQLTRPAVMLAKLDVIKEAVNPSEFTGGSVAN